MSKVALGNGMPLLGGLPVSASRFGVVPGHATTVAVELAKSDQGSPVAVVRRETVPIDGHCDVLGNADTANRTLSQRLLPDNRLSTKAIRNSTYKSHSASRRKAPQDVDPAIGSVTLPLRRQVARPDLPCEDASGLGASLD